MFHPERDDDPNAASEHPKTVVERVTAVEDGLAEMKVDLRELLTLFRGAKTLLGVIKWLGGIAIFFTTMYYMLSNSVPFNKH